MSMHKKAVIGYQHCLSLEVGFILFEVKIIFLQLYYKHDMPHEPYNAELCKTYAQLRSCALWWPNQQHIFASKMLYHKAIGDGLLLLTIFSLKIPTM